MRLEEWNKYIETEFLDVDEIEPNSVSKPIANAELAAKPFAASNSVKQEGETATSKNHIQNDLIAVPGSDNGQAISSLETVDEAIKQDSSIAAPYPPATEEIVALEESTQHPEFSEFPNSEIAVAELPVTVSGDGGTIEESENDVKILLSDEQNLVSVDSTSTQEEVTYSINPLKPVPPTFDIFTAQMSTLTNAKTKRETGETLAVIPERTQLPESVSISQPSLFAGETDLIGENSRPTANPAFYPSLLKYLPSNHPIVVRSESKALYETSSVSSNEAALQTEADLYSAELNEQIEARNCDYSSLQYMRILEKMKYQPVDKNLRSMDMSESRSLLIDRLLNPSLTIEESALLLNVSTEDVMVLFHDSNINENNRQVTPILNPLDSGKQNSLIRLSDVLDLLETSANKSTQR